MSRPTYREHDHWRSYQRFFPEHLRVLPGSEPEEAYWSWRGAEIHLDRFTPERPRFRVILLHGGGGHGRLLAPIGRLMSLAGGECVAPDLPGYGLSRVPESMFRYPSWIASVADLAAAEHARAPLPLFFFGLSLGGMLAYQAAAAARVPVAGVIATTLCDPREPAVREAFAKNRLLANAGLPVLRAANAVAGGVRVPIKWFSKMEAVANDPELAALICRDPMGGGNLTPLGFLWSLMEMVPPVEPEAFERCPVLLAHPGADRWTPVAASLPFFERLAAPKELVMLDGCGHIPLEQPGAARLEEAVRGFIERRLA
jgi:alpha-beta hydrolase superfamily lysophospholipase